ncbi:MAG: hypothetical protein ACKVS9_20270 [Phycisphaerae bacterium]
MNLTPEQVSAIDRELAAEDPEYDAMVTVLAQIRAARKLAEPEGGRPDLDAVCPPVAMVRFDDVEVGLYHDGRLSYFIREPIEGFSGIRAVDGREFPYVVKEGRAKGATTPCKIAVLLGTRPGDDFARMGDLEAVRTEARGEILKWQVLDGRSVGVSGPGPANSVTAI